MQQILIWFGALPMFTIHLTEFLKYGILIMNLIDFNMYAY